MTVAIWAASFAATATAIHLTGLAIAASRIGRRRPVASGGARPPVSLIRPVCGLDNFADETLASTFALDYPDYEIIFCVADRRDPAMPLLRRLIAADPQRRSRLLIGDHRPTANPKLNNIVKGWNAARHQWIVIADSNLRLPRDYITHLFDAWGPDCGLVCSMPIGARPHTFWAEVECAFLNTLQARYQYVSESLGFGFAQGKTMLFRRDIVERAGGLAALAIDNAEDAAATKLVRAAGLRVRLVGRPFEQPLGWRTAKEVWLRQLRWARLRRASFCCLYLPEIFVGSAFPAIAAGIAAAQCGLSVPLGVVLLLSLWIGAEVILAWSLGWHRSWRLAAALLLRDLLLPALWLGGVLGSGFTWRGSEISARGQHGPLPAAPQHRRAADGGVAGDLSAAETG